MCLGDTTGTYTYKPTTTVTLCNIKFQPRQNRSPEVTSLAKKLWVGNFWLLGEEHSLFFSNEAIEW